MRYTDFSFTDLQSICINEAQRISASKKIDLIIFVERAGLPLAVYMNSVMKCKALGIRAERKADKLKSIFFKLGGTMLPVRLKNFLRLIEYKSGFHWKHSERRITFQANMTESEKQSIQKILVIDDSVDTGASMLSVCGKVRETFPDAEIYTYALNVFTESEQLIKIDFSTIRDSIIRTPMSKDSKEHSEFLKMCSEYGLAGVESEESLAETMYRCFKEAMYQTATFIRKITHWGGGIRRVTLSFPRVRVYA